MCRDGWIQGSDMKGTLNPDASSRTKSPPRFYRPMRSLVLLETSRLLFILVLLFLFLFLFSRGILLLFFFFCLCRHFFPFLFCFFSWSLLPPTRLIYSVFFPLRCHSQLPAFCLPPPTSSLFTFLLASPFLSPSSSPLFSLAFRSI